MKQFLDDHFLLQNRYAEILYHEHAAGMPIIDYHNHLPPEEIAANHQFDNITRIWLNGDHYKWRAMRTNGVSEEKITGNAPDEEKFQAWAETVPFTLRNPLYHWTHLELKRYFGITDLLSGNNADRIYARTREMLQQPSHRVRNLLSGMNVRVICTTDDPADTLEHHRSIRADHWAVKVLPAFRPDKAMQIDNPAAFQSYLSRLEAADGQSIRNYRDLLELLDRRHAFFASQGSSVSDHGLEEIYADEYTDSEVAAIFEKLREGHLATLQERRKFKASMLYEMALLDHKRGFVQQFHLGALRNNNSRMMKRLGPDTGWDSIGDFSQAASLAKFLDRLDREEKLTRTIIYNLNPADNESFATMIGNFNDGSIAGKIQWGSAWWFLDQKDGMSKHLNTLSNMGLLSRFVGMLTDSRSFLSFPRHEYFRRILCNLLGTDIANGELPEDLPWIGSVVRDICYNNAASYFGWVENKS
jgi:glucuronate isomerase